MDIETLFLSRVENPLFNTSYPLRPSDWKPYEKEGQLPYGAESSLALYLHIPFCRHLCSFCEYTRMICPDEAMQSLYIDTLSADAHRFMHKHATHARLLGCDIGGGTPTALAAGPFNALMALFRDLRDGFPLSGDFEPSIEGTFATATQDKLEGMAAAGIHRLSLGVQTSDDGVLHAHHRPGYTGQAMGRTMESAKAAGICKINLDIMYGLPGQSPEQTVRDLELMLALAPEQVTLYELRTNMISTGAKYDSSRMAEFYTAWYEGLTANGYAAEFGQNTFSRTAGDKGVSSYLRHRMCNGASYRGFGLSAQSMNGCGLSYNLGKGETSLRELLLAGSFDAGTHYRLPPAELAAKYVAISAYHGAFSLGRLGEILGVDAETAYAPQLDYVSANGLMTRQGDILRITPEGFRHWGAVFSLFYLPTPQQTIITQ